MTGPGAADRPILWLHSHFLLPTGGTKFVYEVVRRLNEQRPVEMVVEAASDHWKERYAEAGVPVHEIGMPTSTSMGYWGLFPRYLKRDFAAVRAHAPRASAIVSSFFPMQWIGSQTAEENGLPHAFLCFEPFPFFWDQEVISMYPAPKRALLWFLRSAYGRVDYEGTKRTERLMTLNRATGEAMKRVYGVNGAVPTYAGVDTKFFHPYSPDELADLRAKHGDGPMAIHSTDFSPIKRTDLAVRAFAAAAVPGSKLLITSTHDDRAGLERVIEIARTEGVGDQVEYMGFLPYEDLPRYYSLADVLMQTGTAQGSGATTMSLPVKEALACGTPVVRSHATDEDVEDGVSGYLVDPEDVEATGARVRELLSDRERGRQMGEEGRRKIVELYRWERVVEVVQGAIS